MKNIERFENNKNLFKKASIDKKSVFKISKIFFSVLLVFCMLFSTTVLVGCSGEEDETYTVVALGDSISAGYAPAGTDMFEDYQKYTSKKVDINEKCYTNLIASTITQALQTEANVEIKNVKAKSYAQSGDTTTDLIAKLSDKNNYPNLENDVKKASLITLCIGANNLLSVVTNQLPSFISGSVTIEEIRSYLNAGYESFKTDYTNTIIPFLTQGNAKVFVMTIYNPFKYFDIAEVEISDSLKEQYAGIESLIENFPTMLELANEFICKINAYMLEQEFENVFVVDVYDAFDKLEKEQFNLYINADSSKVKLRNLTDLLLLQSNVNVDPHPTKAGQIYLSQLFLAEIVANYKTGENVDANKDL